MPPKAEPKQYTPEGQSETTSIALDKATDSLQNAVKASIAELKNVYLDSQRSHNLKHKMDVQTMEQMKKEFDQELKTSGVKLDNATAQIKTLNTQLTEEKIKARGLEDAPIDRTIYSREVGIRANFGSQRSR